MDLPPRLVRRWDLAEVRECLLHQGRRAVSLRAAAGDWRDNGDDLSVPVPLLYTWRGWQGDVWPRERESTSNLPVLLLRVMYGRIAKRMLCVYSTSRRFASRQTISMW